MNILFLCTSNIQRSRTAEDHFKVRYPQHTFRSAGLSKKNCHFFNTTLCTEEMLLWADKIYVFEEEHLRRIMLETSDNYLHKITNLFIEDKYKYMQPELVSMLDKVDLDFGSS